LLTLFGTPNEMLSPWGCIAQLSRCLNVKGSFVIDEAVAATGVVMCSAQGIM
jgi:hypothetical protein